jgi:hypothetical protein
MDGRPADQASQGRRAVREQTGTSPKKDKLRRLLASVMASKLAKKEHSGTIVPKRVSSNMGCQNGQDVAGPRSPLS